MRNIFDSLTGIIERLPRWVILVVVIISLATVPGIFLLKTDSSINTLVSPESAVFKDTQKYQAQFGSDPATIILSGNLQDIFSTDNLARLNQFEQDFPKTHSCYIISPVTILNQAVQQTAQTQKNLQDQIAQIQQQAAAAGANPEQQDQAAAQAEAQVLLQFQSALDQLQQIGTPSLDNPQFIAAALYNQDGSINTSFSSLVPDQNHALLVITPTGINVSAADSLNISHDVRDYFNTHPLQNVSTTTVGTALVTEEISNSMKSNLLLLLGLAVLVMIIVLFVLFRVRWRLLSLLVVALGALWTFGLMGYIPISITMATMAVLPVLIGLGIDYPIQFHNRYQEELMRSSSVKEAIANSVRSMVPAVGIALLATVVGFATLYVSSVPMIRDFGIILVIGVVLCYLVALFLLYSLVYLGDRRAAMSKLSRVSATAGNRIEGFLSRIARPVLKYPLVVCVIAILLGAGGGIADRWLPVNTDYQQLIPQDLPALQNIRQLNTLLGNGGQIYFMVEADNVTGQAFLTKLKAFEDQEISLHPELISASSPASLVSASAQGNIPSQEQIDQILANTAPQFTKSLISSDHKMASLSFGIKYLTLDQIHTLIGQIEQDSQASMGITAASAGTYALSAATIDSVVNSRFLMNALCLGAIFIILLLIYRRFMRSFFIILSIGIVIGWSTLAMLGLGVALNPLTSVLGVITTAIGTEFMVLLTSRYEEEKSRGEPPREAMLTAVSKMGRAVITTGITTLGGFGVLIASNFVVVRDFGIVTVIGIFLCLVSSIIVMPTLMVFWDERRSSRTVLTSKTGT